MITREDVTKVAKLSRLSFTEPEVAQLTTELNGVLAYIDQLSELDVSNVAPLENINESVELNVVRKDEVGVSLSREAALLNAPRSADGYFLVPKVLEQEVKAYVAQDLVGDEEDELF
jgi:aspartyl-tRNA(Asn)/glutamyl-tRNA(Gln) amidotransferase subunit C